ncbi:unnamed protein product [Heligmosomoides polygyrus]|uniref:ATP-dependent DNA helicase n=1 Tax=Heligmosomoides polygyrus TaxID=6339 RepID=A0A183GS95_HELPZ|nr:unnamed protein product [Heligmosomoides polygyrus]
MPHSVAESKAFYDIVERIRILGKDYRSYLDVDVARLDQSEDQVDYEDHRRKGQANYNLLTNDQKLVVNDVLSAIDQQLEQCFFIDGPGGTQPPHGYSKEKTDLKCTGIAANLLPDGRTASSAFRFFLVEDLSRTSSIKRQSEEARFLSKIDVIIWDEAPMAPKQALEAVNALLQDIMQNSKPFGGKIMLLGGDFRQMLPVIEKGSRYDVVQACLKTSSVWPLFKVYKLTTNMRLQANDHEYREWLMKIGNGEAISDENGDIQVPPHLICSGNIADAIFGDAFSGRNMDLSELAILTPRNVDALRINDYVLDRLSEEKSTFLSEDEAIVENPSDALNFPTVS